MRIAMDKLLFLSQRAFADEEPEDGLSCSGWSLGFWLLKMLRSRVDSVSLRLRFTL